MMLQRVQSPGGVVFYRSPSLAEIGVPHAFSTRVGGLSPAPFDSLNLGNPSGCAIQDDRGRIEENYGLLCTAAGLHERELVWVHQVHANQVVWCGKGPFSCDQKADAIVSGDPHRVISVRIADCVPILIATGDGRYVAAVHAGWRGIVAGVIRKAVGELRQAGESALVATIGPCIGFDSFEVGPEVLAEFERVFGPDAPIRRREDAKGYADCREAVRRQLLEMGIERIDTTDRCTVRHREEFFSHRRDKGVTGRMAALIAPHS